MIKPIHEHDVALGRLFLKVLSLGCRKFGFLDTMLSPGATQLKKMINVDQSQNAVQTARTDVDGHENEIGVKATVRFLYGGVASARHWLNEKPFLDVLAVAMITTNPTVITAGFIDSLAAELPEAVIAALTTLIPCYLFTTVPAPYFKKYDRLPCVIVFVDDITAAATSAVTGSAIVVAKRSIIHVPTMLIALVTMLLLWELKLQELIIITAAAMVSGLSFYLRTV